MATEAGGPETRAIREQLEARRAAFAEIVRELAATDDFERLFAVIGERVCRLLQVDSAALVLIEGDQLVLRGSAGLDEALRARPPWKLAGSLVERVILSQWPHASHDMAADPHWRDSPVVTRFGYRASLEVPLVLRQAVVGVLRALHRSPRVFAEEDVALLTELAGHTAVALDRANLVRDLRARLRETETLLTEETRERLRESETIREVSQVLSRNLPTEEAMRRVARTVARAFQADMVGAYFVDARREALVPVAGYHVPKDRLETFLRTPFPLTRFAFLREAWATRRPVWTSDYASDPRFDQAFLGAIRPRALLFVPTLVRGEVAGGLFLVWWTPSQTFTPADLRLIEGVASQVGLALENADLARQTREKLQETETLLSAARALSATLDLQPLLRHFLREVARTIECDSVGVWLANPASGHLEPFAGHHVPPVLREPVRRTWIDLETTPFYAEAIAQRRVVASTEVPGDPRIPGSLKAAAPHRTQLFAPIVVRDRLIGALIAVWWERVREFSDRELTLVEAMASQAGAAIENARLFRENQRKLEELSVLYELSRAVTGQLDVAELVQAIHREVGRVLDARNIAILFYDEERREFEVALRVLDGEADPNPDRRYRLGHGLMSVVVQRRQALRTSDYAETCRQEGVEPVRELLRFRNWLGAPMIAGDRVWGVLALRDAARPFTEADEQLLSNIASLTALAVRSARLYEERTRAYGELASAQDRLVRAEKLRALGEMAGGVAHDFNNLLAVILGRTQLLLKQTQDPTLRRHLDVIQTVAMDGAQTVRRIQEVARMRRARPFRPVNLTAIVEEVVEVTRSRWKDEAQAHGHRVEIHVETRAVPEVAGDPAELREALTNLVFNALDAMPEGGRLVLETGVEGDWVYCIIVDTGVGMSEDVRHRVFDPFFTTKGERGTGLGLSVVYGIVTRHGGEIDVRSAPGRGSVFTIRLPVAREVPAVAPGLSPAPRPRPGARILVVEDEAEVRDVLVEILEAQGHAVTPCADGESGVARLRTEPFDLVFTDLGMPGMSGWEVARLVKLERPGTPVALVTGWSDQIDPAEALGRGVDF
ncbi:MAG: GAF domain-containing protein, partial [Candidatus Rokubacteria bacterium]|nr:GAF domain-containing protein [Candidatus Rokubacteria bacterium]